MASESKTAVAWLVPVAGPVLPPVELAGRTGGISIGRMESCDVRLHADSVSRNHARIVFDGSRWRITDQKSRWGTFVNGMKLEAADDVPLGEGDLLRISPWTFRFSASSSAKAGLLDGAMEAVDDAAETAKAVHTLVAERMPSLGDEMLGLLLDSAGAIHAATSEKTLAEVVLEKACQGSGLPNAAMLKPAGGAGRFEVLASRSPKGFASIVYSRSLINAAADGNVAELSAERQSFDISQSIVSMGVRSALCVPLMLGPTVAAYLYLDSRGDPSSANRLPLRPHASAFCLALGRMASLALANLKRMEMERRSADIEADLAAAAAAQQWILPKRQATFGAFAYTGESRPGEYVGGDFYDILPLDEHRLAVAIGDVSGHGIAASVLMTASAGFLHAVLQETADAEAAINRLNQFIGPRKPLDKFMTMWVGVLDLKNRRLSYIDAGHGYVFMADASGVPRQLPVGEHFPLGIDTKYHYGPTTVELPAAGRLLLISDGIVEQFSPTRDTGPLLPFGTGGVARTAQSPAGEADLVAALFAAVVAHAGRESLSDDATAVLVKW
ncbi:MAG TPA: SpoIIE family protein phosphatase [Tepidisphaeraceae bacterium]|nr:SpoIIE family protein phosphatase [Tepidisphaeraceae bacterium]